MNNVQILLSDISIDNYGDQYTAVIRNQPDLIKGCPMGRGRTDGAALNDLIRRVKLESQVHIDILIG